MKTKDLKVLYKEILCYSTQNQSHWADSEQNKKQNLKLLNHDDFVKAYPLLQNEDPQIQNRIKDELFNFGPLESLINNKDIDEILIHGPYAISFETNGLLNPYQDHFLSESSYQRIIDLITRGFFKSISYENPTGNGFWQNFRIHVISPPLTKNIQVSMRRIGGQKIKTLTQLLEMSFMTKDGFDLLKKAMDQKLNLLICGATGSGKTTLIQCLINQCSHERLVILEDSEELVLPNTLSTALICPTRSEQYSLNFTMKDLVKESLRMRPDRIVLGEARSDEAKDFIQALSTGHTGSIASIHAANSRNALIRLECLISQGAPSWNTQTIRQLITAGINWIICVEKKPSGQRILKQISEITSLEHSGFLIQDLYLHNDY